MGFLTIFFSNAMVDSYTTGVAVHVFSSQINYVLGYKVKSPSGIGKLYFVCFQTESNQAFLIFKFKLRGLKSPFNPESLQFYKDLILNITKFQWTAFLISMTCIVILVITKEYVQPRLNKIRWYPKVPFPMELILVCIITPNLIFLHIFVCFVIVQNYLHLTS